MNTLEIVLMDPQKRYVSGFDWPDRKRGAAYLLMPPSLSKILI
jgi:hypothetical protein